jgi:hypothetical protein
LVFSTLYKSASQLVLFTLIGGISMKNLCHGYTNHTDELARCRQEIADIESLPEQCEHPAWLLALAKSDWELEAQRIEAEARGVGA